LFLLREYSANVFFFGGGGRRNLAKFGLEKYDFDLCKGFSMEKNGSNSPDFKEK
jgi:hypothetical protein